MSFSIKGTSLLYSCKNDF